jgi:hypothetical protein
MYHYRRRHLHMQARTNQTVVRTGLHKQRMCLPAQWTEDQVGAILVETGNLIVHTIAVARDAAYSRWTTSALGLEDLLERTISNFSFNSLDTRHCIAFTSWL